MHKEIKFDYPVNLSGVMRDCLSMRYPTAGDEEDGMTMAVDNGRGDVPISGELCIFSILCGVPYEDLRTLPSSQYRKLRLAYNQLLTARPTEAPAGEGDLNPAPSDPEQLLETANG